MNVKYTCTSLHNPVNHLPYTITLLKLRFGNPGFQRGPTLFQKIDGEIRDFQIFRGVNQESVFRQGANFILRVEASSVLFVTKIKRPVCLAYVRTVT